MKRTQTVQPKATATDMLKALVPAAVMILAVFWINSGQVFGISLNQEAHVKGASVAIADFDGGDFGEALRIAGGQNS
ncbi:hypothetical protein ACN47E_006967 [Coniothyrium glycines]